MQRLTQHLALAALLAAPVATFAQAPALVRIPFSQAFAGVAPGGSSSACSPSVDIPTQALTHTGDGCLATQATLNAPYGATVDALGNVYIADYNDYAVRVVYQGGTALAQAIIAANPAVTNLIPTPGHIYTIGGSRTAAIAQTAGSTGAKAYYCNGAGSGQIALGSNGDNCPASYAYFKPRTIALDSAGNIFFPTPSGGDFIRVIYVGGTAAANLIKTLNGVAPTPGYVYSIMKTSTAGYSGDGQIATNSLVEGSQPRDVAVDANENVYYADGNNSGASANNVRVINGTTGIISTFAGSSGCTEPSVSCSTGFSGDGGPATAAIFSSPYTVFVDSSNNVYISDYSNGRLRVVYAAGTVPGLTNLTPGNIYTVLGGGTSTTSGIPATQVQLATIFTAGIDPAGNLYAFDNTSKALWRVDAKTGIAYIISGLSSVTTVGAPCSSAPNSPVATDTRGDGCPATETLVSPSGRITFDNNGSFYVAESSFNLARKFTYNNAFPATATGSTTTQPLAFLTEATENLSSEAFSLQGATTSEFTDAGNPTCPLNTSTPALTTCVFNVSFKPAAAGQRSGSFQLTGGTLAVPQFLSGSGIAATASVDPASQLTLGSGLKPSGVATDLLGNVYIADSTSGKVFVQPVGGGTQTTALSGLSNPAQIAIDGMGGIYVADSGHNRIAYAQAAGGTVTSLGTGLSAPRGVAVDGLGNLYIADTGNNRIVELLPGGAQFLPNVTGLATPTGLALDASANLYIADTGNNRIVELPTGGSQLTVALGTTTFTPAGVAIDPAGDIYLADSSTQQVLEFPTGSTLSNPLVTGLLTPNGLAIDSAGSIYVSDSGFSGLLANNRNLPVVAFSRTNILLSNFNSLNVTNTGNNPLVFNSALGLSNATTPYSITSATSNGCSPSTAIAPGTDCSLTATFAPLTTGTFTQTATFNTNSPTTAGVSLTGVAVNLITTTLAVNVTSPATTPYNYGQTITVAAVVTPSKSGTAAPTGTVTFTVDGKKQPAQTLTGTTVQLTLNLGVATHTISVSYTGDNLYASSSTSTSFTIVRAATSTSLTLTPVAANATTLTFASTVSSAFATGPTGTVTFYSGSTALSTQTLGATSAASFNTTVLNYAPYTFTAVYSGDANFAPSTSVVVAPTPDFSLAYGTASSFGTAQGGVGLINMTLTPLYGYSGTLTGSCSGLPANSVCAFLPTTTTLTSTGGVGNPQGEQVQIFTNVSSSLARNDTPPTPFGPGPAGKVALALFLPVGLLSLIRRRKPGQWRALTLAALFCSIALISGCQTNGATAPLVTPTGATTVKVTFTDTTGLAHSQNLTFTVYTP